MLPYTISDAAYRYRPLRRGDKGWDVYALQTGLGGLVFDGVFGPATEDAVRRFQAEKKLTVDGVAGIVTQRAVALRTLWPAQAQFETPPGLLRGQIEKESGFQLGNHSARRSDGTWDIGVAQRNTAYTDFAHGFASAESIKILARQLRENYTKYKGYRKITNERRLWELAAGSWNAPSWTDRLARGYTLGPAASEHIEAYIARVTTYMQI